MNSRIADLILFNAGVLTMDSAHPRATWVAVKDNVITAAGRSDMDLLTGPRTRKINCDGMTVIPGFNDAHCHPIGLALTLLQIDCSSNCVKTIADIKARIRERALETPEGEWLRAAQYNELVLAEKRHPNRWDLDEAAPGHPLILSHYSAGTCVLNSMAMRLLGINRETPDSPGDRIGRDPSSGEPDGTIFGNNEIVRKGVPPVSGEELLRGIGLACRRYLASGITSLQDTGWNNGLRHWQTYLKAKSREARLPVRISMLIGTDALENIVENGLTMNKGDQSLRIGGVKLALDEKTGDPHPPQEDINRMAMIAHRAGFQIAFHAHDQQNVRAALIALKQILHQSPGFVHRHRLEHCMVCSPHEIDLMRETLPVVVTQPSFLHFGAESFLETVPHQKLNHLFPVASFRRAGLPVAFGSDSPMNPCDPLTAIYTAVTRKEVHGRTIASEEGISSMEALRMYTYGGAYASGEEAIKGSITPGKLADLVVLDQDPTGVEPDALKKIKVMMTVLDGKIVWKR